MSGSRWLTKYFSILGKLRNDVEHAFCLHNLKTFRSFRSFWEITNSDEDVEDQDKDDVISRTQQMGLKSCIRDTTDALEGCVLDSWRDVKYSCPGYMTWRQVSRSWMHDVKSCISRTQPLHTLCCVMDSGICCVMNSGTHRMSLTSYPRNNVPIWVWRLTFDLIFNVDFHFKEDIRQCKN